MLFHKTIVDTFKSNFSTPIKWHDIYNNYKKDPKEISIAANTYQTDSSITTTNEFTEFITDHPQYGIALFDSQYRPRIIHAIQQISNNTFSGILSNSIHTAPIEFELQNVHFENRIYFNDPEPSTTPNPNPIETSRKSPSPNSPTPTDTPTFIPSINSTWQDLETHLPKSTKTKSIIIIHPIILSSLLQEKPPLSPPDLKDPLIALFFNLLNSLHPNDNTPKMIQSLFTTINTIHRFLSLNKKSHRLILEPSPNYTSGIDYIQNLIPTDLDLNIHPNSTTIPTPTPTTPHIYTTPITPTAPHITPTTTTTNVPTPNPIIPKENPTTKHVIFTNIDQHDIDDDSANCHSLQIPRNLIDSIQHTNNNNTNPPTTTIDLNNTYLTQVLPQNLNPTNTSMPQNTMNTPNASLQFSLNPLHQPNPPIFRHPSPFYPIPTHFDPISNIHHPPSTHTLHNTQTITEPMNPLLRTQHSHHPNIPLLSHPTQIPTTPTIPDPFSHHTQQHYQTPLNPFHTPDHNNLFHLMSSQRNPNTKKNLFYNMSPQAQLVLCRISATNIPSNDPNSPAQSCFSLLQQGSTAKSQSHIASTLQQAGVRGSWQHGHLTSILYHGLSWPSPDEPEGLTFLAIIPSPNCWSKPRQKELSASIRSHYDNNLGDDDIEYMAKQDFFFADNIHEFETQLFTYIAMLGILSGPSSIISIKLTSWIYHYRKYYSLYESQARQKSIWLTRLLYSIDILVQQQISLLEDASTPMHLMSYHPITEGFSRLQDEVIRRNLSTSIPDSIIQLRSSSPNKRKATDSSHETNKRTDTKTTDRSPTKPNTTSKRDNNPNNTSYVTNPRLNSNWKLPEGKSFRECFISSNLIQEAPKHNNTPFCMQYHTTGYCSRGTHCNLVHDDPRDVHLDRNFTSFINKAYKRNPPTPTHQKDQTPKEINKNSN